MNWLWSNLDLVGFGRRCGRVGDVGARLDARRIIAEQTLLLQSFLAARAVADELHGAVTEHLLQIIDQPLRRPDGQLAVELKYDFLRVVR